MLKRGKRGQVTLFVIIGIVILLIVGLAIYFTSRATQTTVQHTPVRTEVSDALKPIQQFVEGCAEQVGREGIVKLGQHGGYINSSDSYISNGIFTKNIYQQYDSDFAYMSNDPNSDVAYWIYSLPNSDCQNCELMSQAPFVSDMERQLGIYVMENIGSCLKNFSDFRQQGYDINASSQFGVVTTIRDSDVLFEVNYPIIVTLKSDSALIDKYYTQVDIPLLKYYNMALTLSKQEYKDNYLERLGLYLINSYSGLDESKLPPISGRTEGYEMKFWTKTGVKQKFQGLLMSYIPVMQVNNTKNYQYIDNSKLNAYQKNFYNFLTLSPFNKTYSNVEVSFAYLGQDTYLDIAPSSGELVSPMVSKSSASDMTLLPPSQTIDYNFYYDMSYPVIVEIREEYKPGEEYTFFFAMEANIKQNLKIADYLNSSKNRIYWDPQYLHRDNPDALAGAKLTDGTAEYDYQTRPAQRLLCQKNQKLSGNITFQVVDGYDAKPVKDVLVTFGCGNYVACPLGSTMIDNTTKKALFSQRFPVCLNGYLELEKEGYLTKKIPLTTGVNSANNIGTLEISKVVPINITVKEYLVTGTPELADGTIRWKNLKPGNITDVGGTDNIIISINKIKESSLDTESSQTVMISNDSPQSTLNLAPGLYTIDARLVNDDEQIISKECKKICYDDTPLNPFDNDKCKNVPEENVNLTGMPKGGVLLDKDMPLYVTADDLKTSQSIELHIFRMPPPLCLDDITIVSDTSAISKKYKSLAMPVFIQ